MMARHALEKYRQALNQKAAEMADSLSNRNVIAIERTAEEYEGISLAAQRELALTMLDRDFYLLKEVHAALKRISEGEYGDCESCEREIRPKRLDAIPWTRCCVSCQEKIDLDWSQRVVPYQSRLEPAA